MNTPKFDKSLLISAYSTPQHAPINLTPENDTLDQIAKTQDRFLELPQPIKEKLSSHKTSQEIQKIGKYFNLELLQLACIARAIRSYYFGELKLADMPFALAKEMNLELTKTQEITKIVINKIINDTTQETAYQSTLEKLTIPEILKNYPEVGEQLITSDKIKLKNFPDFIRPSLKNWMADYTFTLGHDSHNSVERGNYLFQNENTKNLSAFDRQRLALILRCLDDNVPITINKATKQIIYSQPPEDETRTATSQSPSSASSEIKSENNVQSVQFSYPQKAVYEKKSSLPSQILQQNTNTNIPNKISSNLGPNVVNLKD